MKKASIFAALLLLSACGEPSQTTGGEATPQVETKPVALGQTGKAEGVEIIIDKVKAAGQFGPQGAAVKAGPDEILVAVTYTIKNTGGKTLGFMDRPAVKLIDPNGQSYAPDDMIAAMGVGVEDMSNIAIDINPGTSGKASIGWKVAKAAFDKTTWRIVVESNPTLTFALQ
ncbi:DUF4352 domain-containing protein [uncultured Sphingobium sp.]|jgi:hypothetical protein|uniref:DUF4352 domain-containing protein n=1 Tax=uncultured Sphingobium sp. TaxID=316087 RepID=UPI002585BDA6|nr:DUF4352 domain-containing protein [uncultured Sphingobium sp.]